MDQEFDIYDESARKAVEIANQLADRYPDTDLWDIADGLLAGAIHYWLFTRQPCDDPLCEDCEPLNTAEQRLEELKRIVEQFARESEYFHSINDANIGRA